MPCAWRSTRRSPVWVMFCVVAPQCTQPPCCSPVTRAQLPDQRHDGVPGAGETLVEPGAVQQLVMRRLGDGLGRLLGDDAELGLRLGQRRLDIEPGLPAVLQPIQRADAGVGNPGGGRQFVAHLNLHHPHPPHRLVADIDVVFTHVIELAVAANAEQRQAARHLAAVPQFDALDMRRDQQLAGGVDVEGPTVDAVRIDMLDRAWLAGIGVDCIGGERVLAAGEDLAAASITVEARLAT